MEPVLRPVVEEEYLDFVARGDAAFGLRKDEDELRRRLEDFEADRSLAVFVDGEMVATAYAHSLELTLPGPLTTAVAGVASVGVLSTHRRRGLLTRMMRRQLDDVRAAGEPLAALTASEGLIYGRFGYGPAVFRARYRIERSRARLLKAPDGGGVALVDSATASRTFPAVFDEARRLRPGDVSRRAAWWDELLADNERASDGTGALFFVVRHDAQGLVDGYCSYRIPRGEGPARPEPGTVEVRELCALGPDSAAALWSYVCDIDLTERIEAGGRPVDEPLRWLLADPRALVLTYLSDHLWLRLVDVGDALARRRYAAEGCLVMDVTDRFCPWNEGRWRLHGDAQGAEVTKEPPGEAADLSLDVADLASAYLGGVSFGDLARGRRVVEHSPGALRRADALFVTDAAPFCASEF
jgi:predicted acetyltransferase